MISGPIPSVYVQEKEGIESMRQLLTSCAIVPTPILSTFFFTFFFLPTSRDQRDLLALGVSRLRNIDHIPARVCVWGREEMRGCSSRRGARARRWLPDPYLVCATEGTSDSAACSTLLSLFPPLRSVFMSRV